MNLEARAARARPVVEQMVTQNNVKLTRDTRNHFKRGSASLAGAHDFDDVWMGEWGNAETGD